MDRLQINVRLTPEQLEQIDRKRIELQPKFGKILSKSDIIRLALDDFLASPTKATSSSTKTRLEHKK